MSTAERLAAVRQRMVQAAERAGRHPDDITLVGISKGQKADAVAEAVAAGLGDVGENYLQEALEKLTDVTALLEKTGVAPPRWHFVGQLQRNKARDVARRFDVVQSVDRARLGAALQRRADEAGRTLDVLLQVDLSEEPGKGGALPADLAGLLEASRGWSALRVVGLMAVPAPGPSPEASRAAFRALRELRDELRQAPGGETLSELSMGMSGDFEVAIEEGATLVRVGTAIFGERKG